MGDDLRMLIRIESINRLSCGGLMRFVNMFAKTLHNRWK